MRGSTTKTRRSPGWRGLARSIGTESSGSTWTHCWNHCVPIRASTIWCSASACPRPKRDNKPRAAKLGLLVRNGLGGGPLKRLALLLLLVGLAAPGRAQLSNEGSIEGTVTDSSGAVIPGVALRVANLSTSVTFNTTTNELGLFRFPVLPVGSYELLAERLGFASLIQKNVVVNVGAEINLTLTLLLATGTEKVVVSGETPLLESTRSQVSTTVVVVSGLIARAKAVNTSNRTRVCQVVPPSVLLKMPPGARTAPLYS